MSLWNGFECKEFEFDGKKASLVFPENAIEGKYWALKTEYRDAYPETEIALLKEGFHIAWLENDSRLAPKSDCDRKARFAQFLSEEYGLSPRCVPIGMSCGGAHAVNLAGDHPECVSCLFIDAPVLNFLDFPGDKANKSFEKVWENEFKKTYPGLTRADLLNFDRHPMNKIKVLQENKIPVLMLYGTEDCTVDYSKNGAIMEEAYESFPGLLTIIPRLYEGHHPHGFPQNPQPIVDFILKNCK